MPITLALQILAHPEWADWYTYLSWFLVRAQIIAKGWVVEGYIRSWRAEQASRTRHHGRLPDQGLMTPLGALAVEFGYGPEDVETDPATGVRTIKDARPYGVALVPDTPENRAAGAQPIVVEKQGKLF